MATTSRIQIAAAPPSLCPINRAAERLAVSRSTIYRMVREKKLQLVQVGRRSSRITESSILAVMNSA